MIIHGQFYDGVVGKPDLDEALEHYGVMGMKWGIRKDIRKTGSISKKTKKKISDAVKKASYGKTRRMLNGLEDLKSISKGKKEEARSKKDKVSERSSNKNIKELNRITKDTLNTANKLGYKYDTKKVQRVTDKSYKGLRIATNTGQFLLGPVGGLTGGLIAKSVYDKKDRQYRVDNNSKNSPYYTYDTDAYLKKKKK